MEWLVIRSRRTFSLHVERLGVVHVVVVGSVLEAEVAKIKRLLLSLHVHVSLWVGKASILVDPVRAVSAGKSGEKRASGKFHFFDVFYL